MCPVLGSGTAKKKLMKRSVMKNKSTILFNTNNAFKFGLENATSAGVTTAVHNNAHMMRKSHLRMNDPNGESTKTPCFLA
ncbi:unnamed protein product [Bathycoccus prasinos]